MEAENPPRAPPASGSEVVRLLRHAGALLSEPAAGKAGTLHLPRHAGTSEAFQRIIAGALQQFLDNASPARAGDAEGVHQMRVALRRLRAALALFAPLLEPRAAEPVADELRRLGRVFGAARDWDVFCLSALPGAFNRSPQDGLLHRLAEAAEPRRQAARRRLSEELGGFALAGVIGELARWAEGTMPRGLADGGKPIEKPAPRLLDRLAAKVARRGSHIRRRSAAELHELRKSLKKLRYAAEDLGSLYAPKRVKAYTRRCKRLLDRLGAINDAAVTRRLLGEIGSEAPAELAPAMLWLGQWNDARRARAMRELGKAWKAVRKAEPFWS